MIKKKLKRNEENSIKKITKKQIKKKKGKVEVFKHPEMEDGERWIGNGNEYTWKQIAWTTKRKGKVPYGVISNKPMDGREGRFFPIFIKEQEYQDYIQKKFNMKDLEEKNGTIKKKKLKRGGHNLGKGIQVWVDQEKNMSQGKMFVIMMIPKDNYEKELDKTKRSIFDSLSLIGFPSEIFISDMKISASIEHEIKKRFK